jgi:hypothetical protein
VGELAADFHHRARRVDHLLATLEHFFAALAQTQLARGALQQASRQRLFESRNTPAHRRRRNTQLPRRCGETAGFHHFDEDRHFTQQRQGKIDAHNAQVH